MDTNRRKLLKGSAAAPLILTVRPAAATARTSLAVCIERDATRRRPDQILASNSHADEWMRAKVDILELTVWDSDKKKWVELEDRRFFLGFDKTTYWQLDRHDPYRAPASPSRYHKGTSVREEKKGERHALVYVNNEGRVVGTAWEKRGGTHCTQSCWASVIPTHRA